MGLGYWPPRISCAVLAYTLSLLLLLLGLAYDSLYLAWTGLASSLLSGLIAGAVARSLTEATARSVWRIASRLAYAQRVLGMNYHLQLLAAIRAARRLEEASKSWLIAVPTMGLYLPYVVVLVYWRSHLLARVVGAPPTCLPRVKPLLFTLLTIASWGLALVPLSLQLQKLVDLLEALAEAPSGECNPVETLLLG